MLMPTPSPSMTKKTIQNPLALWISGRPSKFMPKKPVTRLSGRKIAVSTVSARMMSLVRLQLPGGASSSVNLSSKMWKTRTACAMRESPRAQGARRVESEVREHAIGTGALEGAERFHHHRVVVEPAVLRRRLEHRVLAAHLVGERRQAELVFDTADDVEVRHARLDHHHVGALGDVERHFAQRFVAVARVHLVDLLVAFSQVGGRADGVAKRAVEGARVLGAVGHDP